MRKIKLIALDIGKTLITDQNKITSKNIDSIRKARESGIKIALVTARMYSSTRYISNLIAADYGVFGNGSNIMELKTTHSYYSENIPIDLVLKLIEFANRNKLYIHLNGLTCEFSNENKYFALKHNLLNKNYPEHLKSNIIVTDDLCNYVKNNPVIKAVFVSELDIEEYIIKIENEIKGIYVNEYSKGLFEAAINKTINYIEVGVKKTTKADGLLHLIDVLNLSKEEVLIIGDGKNDIELFETFPYSGCVSNSILEIKNKSSYVSKFTNNESGVAEIIEYYMRGMGR